MAVLEVVRNGEVIIRREVDDVRAAEGCEIQLGPDKSVQLSTGQTRTVDDLEVRILAGSGEAPAANQEADRTLDADSDLDLTTDLAAPTEPPPPPGGSRAASESLDVTAPGPSDADPNATIDEPSPRTDTHGTPSSAGGSESSDSASRSSQEDLGQTMDPETGHPQIEGYEVRGKLGEGAMGSVWHAVQMSTRREVALKFMGRGRFGSDRSRIRFEREVELAARLEHPNIARVYDSGLHRGGYYYAMEMIQGQDLEEYIQDNQLGRQEVLEMMETICRAVQHAHQRGVIHRDLKPGNIMVNDEGKPYVVDFGLAKTLAEETDEGLNISIDGESTGTPAYMSPEQAAGRLEEIDTRTDVYSLGVILYRLLTGQPPHELTGSRFEFLRRVVEEEVRRPREVSPEIDSELEALLLKALAQDPAQRYDSAGELADDIHNYLTGEPLAAKKATTGYFLAKKLRKHRTAVLLACLVLLAGFGGTVYSFVRITNERNRAIAQEQIAQTERRKAVDAAEKEREAREELQRNQEALRQAKTDAEEARDEAIRQKELAEKARDEADQALYVNQVARAEAELRQYNVASAREVLAQCKPDLRGWEWRHLRGVVDQSARTLPGHEGGNAAVAFAGGPDRVATVSRSGVLQICDAATGRVLSTAQTDSRGVVAAAFNREARRVVLTDIAAAPQIRDTGTGEALAALEGAGSLIYAAAFGPEGKLIATGGGDGKVRVWDGRTGSLRETFEMDPQGEAICVAFDAVASRIAAGGSRLTPTGAKQGILRMWELSSPDQSPRSATMGREITAVAFSPDGQRIAASDADGRVKVWSTSSDESQAMQGGHEGRVSAVAFTRDGRQLISGGNDRMLRVWDVNTGNEVASLAGHAGGISSIAVSPEGNWIASAGADQPVRLWDAGSNWVIVSTPAAAAVESVAVSQDGKWIAAADRSGTIQLLDASSCEVRRSVQLADRALHDVTWLRDGLVVAACEDGMLRLWSAESGEPAGDLGRHAEAALCVSASADGALVISGGRDGAVKLWDARAKRPIKTLGSHTGDVAAVALSRDGKRAASGGDDGLVKLWDVQAGKLDKALPGHDGRVEALTFSPDGGQLGSSGDDRTVLIWDIASREIAQKLTGHTKSVRCMAYSRDGSRLVSGSVDRTLKVWDPAGGTALLTLLGHSGHVTGVAFTPDDRAIVSGGLDQSICRWGSAEAEQQPADEQAAASR